MQVTGSIQDFKSTERGVDTHHLENTKKNLWTRVAATAFGYSWHVLATSIAHDTPPRNPSMLE